MAANCPLVPSVWGVLRRARTRVLRVIRPPGCSLATHGRSQPSPSPRHAAAFARHFHAATLELSHRSAPPEHSRHRKADNTLAEASSLLSTRPVTALSPAQHHRLPNLATCTRARSTAGQRRGIWSPAQRSRAQHVLHRPQTCTSADWHVSPAHLAARARVQLTLLPAQRLRHRRNASLPPPTFMTMQNSAAEFLSDD